MDKIWVVLQMTLSWRKGLREQHCKCDV